MEGVKPDIPSSWPVHVIHALQLLCDDSRACFHIAGAGTLCVVNIITFGWIGLGLNVIPLQELGTDEGTILGLQLAGYIPEHRIMGLFGLAVIGGIVAP